MSDDGGSPGAGLTLLPVRSPNFQKPVSDWSEFSKIGENKSHPTNPSGSVCRVNSQRQHSHHHPNFCSSQGSAVVPEDAMAFSTAFIFFCGLALSAAQSPHIIEYAAPPVNSSTTPPVIHPAAVGTPLAPSNGTSRAEKRKPHKKK